MKDKLMFIGFMEKFWSKLHEDLAWPLLLAASYSLWTGNGGVTALQSSIVSLGLVVAFSQMVHFCKKEWPRVLRS
jgi:hypothetical protein